MNRTARRQGQKEVRREFREFGAGVFEPMKPTPFAHIPSAPNGVFAVWTNNLYVVQAYRHDTEWGEVINLMVRRNDGAAVRSWRDMQRIKNECCGEETVAVEVYPAQSDVVDQANLYHLWVLPPGFALPFGLHDLSKTKVLTR